MRHFCLLLNLSACFSHVILKRHSKWCLIYQSTSFAKMLTYRYTTLMFIAGPIVNADTVTVPPTILWWWIVTLSSSFTSSSITQSTAWSPRSPFRPSSINRICSMNSNVNVVCNSIQVFYSNWYASNWIFSGYKVNSNLGQWADLSAARWSDMWHFA